ncbi:hypothetical protein [Nonomuraea turkmeniaca]|uniref:hypothetical protein n=1 Tax=Nonomuraea turkmeniaca TaxID=103838 RepID=UPI001476EC62|nr:hypothetical protein [Nonomuraea turkmeniaca]
MDGRHVGTQTGTGTGRRRGGEDAGRHGGVGAAAVEVRTTALWTAVMVSVGPCRWSRWRWCVPADRVGQVRKGPVTQYVMPPDDDPDVPRWDEKYSRHRPG